MRQMLTLIICFENVNTDNTAHAPRDCEKVYYSFNEACGESRQTTKLVPKYFKRVGKGNWVLSCKGFCVLARVFVI